ncbi:MAG: GtrA family protein [Acidimicrobiales bacterium]
MSSAHERSPGAERVTRVSLYERMRRSPMVGRLLKTPLVERILSPTQGDRNIHKFIRYSMVSGVAIVISELVILVSTWAFGLSGIAANTLGSIAATPASYELNRQWAWGKHGKSHLWKEVVPFWVLTIIGFLASTGTTQLADTMAHRDHITGLARALAIMAASLFAWGVVWIVKFVVFNKLVFVVREVDVVSAAAAPGTSAPSSLAGPAASPVASLSVSPARPVPEPPPSPAFEGSAPGSP